MKKKCIRFLPLLLACLLLGGCFLEPAEGLYAVPKQSEEYYDLQNAIELALPDGAVYAPPVSGDNQQVVQMVDLDGDGEDEAVVYCKTTGELPLGIYVFDRQNDAFTLAASVQGAGSAFHHVSYVSFDDQPGYELVVGRQISDQVPQLMNVYSLRGGTLTELMSTEYAEFVTADLDADSRQEIVVLHSGGDSQIVRVCCRLGRNIVYGKDQSIKGWKSVYLKITHPTTTGADVSFKVEAVENSGTNTSEETYIMLYGPAPGGGLIDSRTVPVLPIYD